MNDSLKSRLARGDQLFGISTSITTDKYEAERIVSEGPYDFVWIDGQHSPVDQNEIADFSFMMTEMGVHVQFRIEHARNAYLIGHYLDLGISGIEVPQVEKTEEVQEILKAAKDNRMEKIIAEASELAISKVLGAGN